MKNQKIIVEKFLDKKNVFAVVGASRNPEKYGYQVFKELKEAGYEVYPVNPNSKKILGVPCYRDLEELPKNPDVVNIVIPPLISKKIVEKCKKLGISKIWFQPGSESQEVLLFCEKNNIFCIHNLCIILKNKKESKK